MIGYILTGAGLALLNAPTHALALVATAAFGLGYGIVTPPTNLSAAEAGGKNSAGLVSLLNFAWGIGAVACSPLIMLALRHQFLSTLLYALALCAFALAGCFLFVSFPARASRQSDGVRGTGRAATPALAITVAVSPRFSSFTWERKRASAAGPRNTLKRLAGACNQPGDDRANVFLRRTDDGSGVCTAGAVARPRELRVVTSALGLAMLGVVMVIAATSERAAIVRFCDCGRWAAPASIRFIFPGFRDGTAPRRDDWAAWCSRWHRSAGRRCRGWSA